MSATKISLEQPYSEKWKSGYVVKNGDGRRTLILYNSHKDRSSTQYARYLLAVKLGRYLTYTETVDHIDGDKNHDVIGNLQILSRAQNVYKHNKKPDIEMTCPVCGVRFFRSRSFLRGKMHKAMASEVCCSRSCGGKFSHRTR